MRCDARQQARDHEAFGTDGEGASASVYKRPLGREVGSVDIVDSVLVA